MVPQVPRKKVFADRVLAGLARLMWLVSIPFVRYDIRGGACVERLHTGVVVANHRSFFDAFIGPVALHRFRRYPRVLVAAEFVYGRWTGPLARALGCIPVDRSGDAADALRPAIDALRSGIPILILPEGRLHWDPDAPLSTGPPKTGASRIAMAAGAPVLAVGHDGTQHVWPKGRRFPRLNPFRRRTVVVQVDDAEMYLDDDDHVANMDRVMVRVRALVKTAAEAREATTQVTKPSQP